MTERTNYCEDNMFRFASEHHDNVEEFSFFQHQHLQVKDVSPTGDGYLSSAQDFFRSSTLELGERNYQISFQQNFIQDHTNAFQKQTENFIESSFKFTQEKIRNFKSDEIFSEHLEFQRFSCIDDALIEFDKKMESKSEILTEDKLKEFFEFFYDSCPKKLAIELVYLSVVAYEDWRKTLKTLHGYDSQSYIVNYAKKLAIEQSEKLFFDQRIKFLNLSIVQKSKITSEVLVKKAFRQFLSFLFATIILIVEGYFQNPFTGQDEGKRSIRSFRLESEFYQNDNQNSFSSADSIQLGMPKKRKH